MQPIILPELYPLILQHLSQKQLLQLKLVNKLFKSIIDKFADDQLSHIKSLFANEIEQLKYICRNGNYLLIGECFQNMNKNVKFWNDMMYEACQGGYLEIVKLMIEKGANNWNWGLYGACRGGHMEIVKFMIEKGADNWNWGLCGGHMEIVKLMIEKGANGWNVGLFRTCRSGHMEIVKLMIEKGANNWNWGLEGACFGGHMEIVKLMIEKGATQCNHCRKPISEHI